MNGHLIAGIMRNALEERQMSQRVYMTVQVPADLRADIDHLARTLDKSTSEIVKLALEEMVSRREKESVDLLQKMGAQVHECELVDVFARWTSPSAS